jgi:hypothetical protein
VHRSFGLPQLLEQFVSIWTGRHRRSFRADTIGPFYNAVLKRDFLLEMTPFPLHGAYSFLLEEPGAQTAFSSPIDAEGRAVTVALDARSARLATKESLIPWGGLTPGNRCW